MYDAFSPPRLAIGGYLWLAGHPPITAESSQRVFLALETFVREQWHLSEQVQCTGLYVGPRLVWARFVGEDGNRMAIEDARSDFDEWQAL